MTTSSTEAGIGQHLPAFPWHRRCPFSPPDNYTLLREREPVSQIMMATGQPAWLITRHDHARQVLSDPRASSDRAHPGFPYFIPVPAQFRTSAGFLGMDPPEHTVHRRLLVGEFTARRVEEMRPDVQRIVDARIDAILAGPCPTDLVQELSLPVPMSVICGLLGVPYEEHEFFHKRARVMFGRTSTAEQRRGAIAALMEYFTELVTGKEQIPGDDLISRAIARYREAGVYDRDDMVVLVRLLLNAGHETSANMISLGVLALLQHPQQQQGLHGGAKQLYRAVEELLRYLSPSDLATSRVAVADMEVGDVRIRAGEAIIIVGASANHDPAAFVDPDRLDVGRNAGHHVSFGHGVHRCIGGPLAQMELEVVYSTVFRRIPRLALAVPFEDLQFKDGAIMYGAYEVPVTW